MQKISIENAFGEKLAGVLHNSHNSNNLVIVCHGRLCTKDDFFSPSLCEDLAKNGFNAYRFDFSGNGESEGSFEDSTMTDDIEDIKAVVDFFKNKNYEIFCLIGHSQGAAEVLLNQAKYNDAGYVVDIAGTIDQKHQTLNKFTEEQIDEINKQGFTKILYKGKETKVTKKYFYDRVEYGDITKKVEKITVPVLIIHGTKDEDTPINHSKSLICSLNKKSELIVIQGAGHFFKGKYEKELKKEIISWLKKVTVQSQSKDPAV